MDRAAIRGPFSRCEPSRKSPPLPASLSASSARISSWATWTAPNRSRSRLPEISAAAPVWKTSSFLAGISKRRFRISGRVSRRRRISRSSAEQSIFGIRNSVRLSGAMGRRSPVGSSAGCRHLSGGPGALLYRAPAHSHAVLFQHFEHQALELHALPDLGRMSQQGEDEAAYGIDFFVLQGALEDVSDLVHPDRSGGLQPAVLVVEDIALGGSAFRHHSRHFMEQIREGDNALGAAEFVQDHA